jgi:hypothetical protein
MCTLTCGPDGSGTLKRQLLSKLPVLFHQSFVVKRAAVVPVATAELLNSTTKHTGEVQQERPKQAGRYWGQRALGQAGGLQGWLAAPLGPGPSRQLQLLGPHSA